MPAARGRTPTVPACYALVVPGLEPVAAQEIEARLRGRIKRMAPGVVVFRVPEVGPRLLELRTTEDVFLLAWGTDELTYRAEDLRRIQAWTARQADWGQLLQRHHQLRPKPKGKPTYRLVAQMTGSHVYRRADARDALAKGLAGKLPASWRPVEENASVEVWLTIHEATALCGLRLSDRTMRHRTYKVEHVAASLRPTVAAALVRLAQAPAGAVFLDPMCGAGTILAEFLAATPTPPGPPRAWGGDRDQNALRAARANLRRLGPALLARWDAGRLPLANASVDRVVSNPPFGRQLGRPEDVRPLYRRLVAECDRVLRPAARAVVLVADQRALRAAAARVKWLPRRELALRVLGQRAVLSVWAKP